MSDFYFVATKDKPFQQLNSIFDLNLDENPLIKTFKNLDEEKKEYLENMMNISPNKNFPPELIAISSIFFLNSNLNNNRNLLHENLINIQLKILQNKNFQTHHQGISLENILQHGGGKIIVAVFGCDYPLIIPRGIVANKFLSNSNTTLYLLGSNPPNGEVLELEANVLENILKKNKNESSNLCKDIESTDTITNIRNLSKLINKEENNIHLVSISSTFHLPRINNLFEQHLQPNIKNRITKLSLIGYETENLVKNGQNSLKKYIRGDDAYKQYIEKYIKQSYFETLREYIFNPNINASICPQKKIIEEQKKKYDEYIKKVSEFFLIHHSTYNVLYNEKILLENNEITDLLKDCFSSFVFDRSDNERQIIDNNLDHVSKLTYTKMNMCKFKFKRSDLISLYINKYYIHPKIVPVDIDNMGRPHKNCADSIDTIKTDFLNDKETKFCFLLGDVGDGKSIFLSKLFCETKKEKKVVILDAEEFEIKKRGEGYLWEDYINEMKNKYLTGTDSINSILFIVDNLDVIDIHSERYIFQSTDKRIKSDFEKKNNERIDWLETLIDRNENAKFIFSLRPYTYTIFKHKFRQYTNISKLFRLQTSKSSFIFSTRIKMLCDLIGHHSKNTNDEKYLEFLENLKQIVNKTEVTLEEIKKNLNSFITTYNYKTPLPSFCEEGNCEEYYTQKIKIFNTIKKLNEEVSEDITKQLNCKNNNNINSLLNKHHFINLSAENQKKIKEQVEKWIDDEQKKKTLIKINWLLKDSKIWNDETIFDTLHHISCEGYRSILKFYKENICQKTDVLERFFSNNVLLLFMLDGFKKFSQIHDGDQTTHYPNLFLIRGDTILENKYKRNNITFHNHPIYFLKYLILLLLGKRKKIDLCFFEEVFFGNEKKYGEEIVKLTLGSLVTTNSSNCINYDYDKKVLELSRRGKFLIGENTKDNAIPYCFSFNSLQLFFDDYWLIKPRPDLSIKGITLTEEEKDVFESKGDYSYLFDNKKDFHNNLEKIIMSKAKKSLMLSKILKTARNFEYLKYKDTWDIVYEYICDFKNEYKINIFNDFNKIDNNFNNSFFENINSHIINSASHAIGNNDEQVIENLKNFSKNLNNSEYFSLLFENYNKP